MAKKNKNKKIYKAGQFITINGKLFRITKPPKRWMIGVCHICDLGCERQFPAGSICHKYCYRRQYATTHQQYVLKQVKICGKQDNALR